MKKILETKTPSHGPPLSTNLFYLPGTRCRFHDWFLLRLEIVEVCLKYPLRSQQCPSSIKLSPQRLYVYPSQYLGLDKRPNNHFIPQTTYLTNLPLCTWFTAVNDISKGRQNRMETRLLVAHEILQLLKSVDGLCAMYDSRVRSPLLHAVVWLWWPEHRSGPAHASHDKG